MPSARRSSRSSKPRPSSRACASSNPTTRSPSSKTSTRRTRRRSSTSCRPIERVALQRSLDYPEGSAGRRMQTEFIAVPPFWTVGQTIDFMRETADLPDTFYEIFVIDPAGHLLGAVPLDRLLRSQAPGDHRRDHGRRAGPGEGDRRRRKRWRACSSATTSSPPPSSTMPDRLVGVMMVDDIVDVLEEEADADIKRSAAFNSDEELSDTV